MNDDRNKDYGKGQNLNNENDNQNQDYHNPERQNQNERCHDSRKLEYDQEQRGGSHEQHVKAGHEGGKAPHTCRGRECNNHSSSEDKTKNEDNKDKSSKGGSLFSRLFGSK